MTLKPPPNIPVEPAFDAYVKEFGGELIKQIVGKNPNFDNADYLFREEDIIAELKCLQSDFFSEKSYQQKIKNLLATWVKTKVIPPPPRGSQILLDTAVLPEKCAADICNLIVPPIQRVVKKANKQIRETKEKFQLPDAKGLLLLVNDGNYSLESEAVIYALSRALGKEYSSIHNVAYFTVNMPAVHPDSDYDCHVWIPCERDEKNSISGDFLSRMSKGWTQFYSDKIGQAVSFIHCDDAEMIRELRFIPPSRASRRVTVEIEKEEILLYERIDQRQDTVLQPGQYYQQPQNGFSFYCKGIQDNEVQMYLLESQQYGENVTGIFRFSIEDQICFIPVGDETEVTRLRLLCAKIDEQTKR